MKHRCSKCRRLKPLDQFNRDSVRGIQNYCKKCSSEYTVKWNAENKEHKSMFYRIEKAGGKVQRYDICDRAKRVADYVPLMRPRTKKLQESYDIMLDFRAVYGRWPSRTEISRMKGDIWHKTKCRLKQLAASGYLVKRDVYDRIKNHSEEVTK